MAKKFGKFLLFLSTVGAAFAGAYYYMKTKQAAPTQEDDYDDLDDDSYEVTEDQPSGERSYVSLHAEEAPEAAAEPSSGTTVEEFFDDDDDDSDGSLDAI